MAKKLILDVTCGGRTIWFDKKNPHAVYCDIRREKNGFIKDRKKFSVNPDMIADFRDLPFPDKKFKIVVFDPPHMINLRENSWIAKKYGVLNEKTWRSDIRRGFDECWRVLEDYGTLIMKWSCSIEKRKNRDIPLKEVLKILPHQALFGHTSGAKSNTMWLCFMKIPERYRPQKTLGVF